MACYVTQLDNFTLSWPDLNCCSIAFSCFFILHGAFTLSDLENACCKCYGFGSKKTFQKSNSLPNMEFKQVHERHFRRTAYMNTYLMCLGWAAGSVGTLACISHAIPDIFSARSALQSRQSWCWVTKVENVGQGIPERLCQSWHPCFHLFSLSFSWLLCVYSFNCFLFSPCLSVFWLG